MSACYDAFYTDISELYCRGSFPVEFGQVTEEFNGGHGYRAAVCGAYRLCQEYFVYVSVFIVLILVNLHSLGLNLI